MLSKVMRAWLAVAFLLAGCASPQMVSEDAAFAHMDVPPAVPAPMRLAGAIPAGQSVLEDAGACGAPSPCHELHFTLERNASLSASLAWGVPVNDLDLYLYAGNAFVAMDRVTGPGTHAGLDLDLTSGDYRLIVVPFAAAAESFVLEATFAPVP